MSTMLAQLLAGLLAAGSVIGAARLLWARSWIAGWVRGSCGLLLLSAALLCLALALDLRTYRPWPQSTQIASVHFRQLGEQHFIARVVEPNASEQVFELFGDQWQFEVSMLNWNRALRGLGLAPAYRIDRLGSRYLVLEQQLSAPPRSYALFTSQPTIDRLVHAAQYILPWLRPEIGRVAYLPMSAGAEYTLRLNALGLTPQAENAAARRAMAGR